MNMDHSPECVCEECMRHEFLERVRSAVCHLCNRPRDHWTHQQVTGEGATAQALGIAAHEREAMSVILLCFKLALAYAVWTMLRDAWLLVIRKPVPRRPWWW